MSKKGDRIWRIVKILTLAIPLPVYLFLSATLFSITPDYTIYAEYDTVWVVEHEDGWLIYSSHLDASYDGHVIRYGDLMGIVITSDDIIKIGKDYYSYIQVDGVYQLTDISRFELQQQQSYKIPLSFFISLGGVLVIAMIVQNKMQWHKAHPKGAALLALVTGTAILYVIDMIVSSVLGVFLIATISWGLFLLEDLVQKGIITQSEAEQTESDLIRQMKKALKDND